MILEDAGDITSSMNFNEMENKSILITGASGLVGVYFLASLNIIREKLEGRLKIYAVMQSQPPEFVKSLLENARVEVFLGSVTEQDFLTSLPNADYIIHAAGYGQPGRFMEDRVKTILINTLGTVQLLSKLNEGGKFLFVSTSEVYNGLTEAPFNENQIGTTNTTHPRSCYIESKRCGEAICNAHRQSGVNAKSARLCLAYGPGTRPNDKRAINSFIQRGVEERHISLMDQGLAKRTYCYVSDAVEIMWSILLKGKNPIYNVGGFSKVTIADLAKDIGAILDVKVSLPETSNALEGAPDDVFLDMGLVEREFSKTSYVPIGKGLARTIEWQKIMYDGGVHG